MATAGRPAGLEDPARRRVAESIISTFENSTGLASRARYRADMEPAELAEALAGHPATAGIGVLVLHGSRARGDAGPTSDWDFAYLRDDHPEALPPDPAALIATITGLLGTDAVDLVDLAVASALLRFRAARDGLLLREARHGAFLDFRLDAVQFWCDAGPVIRAAQADILASLG